MSRQNNDPELSDLGEQDQLDNDTGARRAANRAGEETSKQAKKALKKAGEAAKKGKYASGFGKILYFALAVIIILVMVIGFISFSMNMPGLVVDSILKAEQKVIATVKNWYNQTDISGTITEDDKKELLTYLKDMGYNLVGMGFAKNVTLGAVDSGNPNGAQKVTGFEEWTYSPSYLFSYIFANERIYVGKNTNLLGSLKSIFGISTNASDTWGEGMLNIFGEQGIFDKYEIDRENLTLTFKNAQWFHTDVFKYDIDGWSGRYGTPIELLLAVHSATMMPDLVYEFVTSEDLQTVVNIEAKEVPLKLHLKVERDGKELPIQLGTKDEEAIDIKFNTNEQGEVIVENLDDIMAKLESEDITLAQLKKTFDNFDYLYKEYLGGDYAIETMKSILAPTDSSMMYVCYQDNNGYLMNDLLGSYFWKHGNTDQILIGNWNQFTGENLTFDMYKIGERRDAGTFWNIVHYSYQGEGITYSGDATLVRIATLQYFWSHLYDSNENVIQDCADLQLTPYYGSWQDAARVFYCDLMRGPDEYFSQLKKAGVEGINYDENNTYSSRMENFINQFNDIQTFSEYINANGLADQPSEAQDGFYTTYKYEKLNAIYNNGDNEIGHIFNELQANINATDNMSQKAEELKIEMCKTVGLSQDQINEIYTRFIENPEEIVTFVPMIRSVVKHWYKDLIFNYNTVDKGTLFEVPYEGTVPDGYAELYYVLETLDASYPVQDGEPYVIKGDSVTRDGKEVDAAELSSVDIDKETLKTLEDTDNPYTLGDGYKTSKKLFTQGYYYQYDGTEATAEEIEVAKKLESYPAGTTVKIIVWNGKLKDINTFTEGLAIGNRTVVYKNSNGDIVDNVAEASKIMTSYCTTAPGAYISPVDGTYEESQASVEAINKVLKEAGTGLRREKVSMSNSTNSLTALSILESMHSLDADYIYREFKEFLIDLGYYSRAELDTLDKSALDWFIPSYTPEEWPPKKEDILQYGTTVYSETYLAENADPNEFVTIDKMESLDNFRFISDISTGNIFSTPTLATGGSGITYGRITTADDLASFVQGNETKGIAIYASEKITSADKSGETRAQEIKQLIIDTRTKLKDAGYENYNIPIYVLQVLPCGAGVTEPDLLCDQIDIYNNIMYSWCIGQEGTTFIDCTTGMVNESGFLDNFNTNTVATNIINKIIIQNVNHGGFAEGTTVITPGAGYITAISSDEITIEFSVTEDPDIKAVDGFTMVIKGLVVEPQLISDFGFSSTVDAAGNKILALEKLQAIGLTGTTNIEILLRDENKAILDNIEDYMPLPEKSTGSDLGALEDICTFILTWEGGLNSNVDGDCWIVIPDQNYPGDWRCNTAGGSGITNYCEAQFYSTGHADLFPMELGDRVPIDAILEIKAAVVQEKFDILEGKLAQHGIIDWGFDQKAAFVSLMYNGYGGRWNSILDAYAKGDMKTFVKLWMNCGNLRGHFYRRAVELDLFFTGDYEITEARKSECLSIYSNYKGE